MTETTACPECDSCNIARRTMHDPSSEQTRKWYCRNCQTRFDAPTRREREGIYGGRHGLAGELARMGERRAADD